MRQNFSTNQEITRQDLNSIPSRVEVQLYDRIIRYLVSNTSGDGQTPLISSVFFGGSFEVTRTNATRLRIQGGIGFHSRGGSAGIDRVEPIFKMLWGLDNYALDVTAADATNNRIDLVVVQERRIDLGRPRPRRFQAPDETTPSFQSTPVVTDWDVEIRVIAGTPAPTPVAPPVPTGFIAIASVMVTASTGIAATGAITDLRTLFNSRYETSAQTASRVTNATADFETGTEIATRITTATADFETGTEIATRITTALDDYDTSDEVDTKISATTEIPFAVNRIISGRTSTRSSAARTLSINGSNIITILAGDGSPGSNPPIVGYSNGEKITISSELTVTALLGWTTNNTITISSANNLSNVIVERGVGYLDGNSFRTNSIDINELTTLPTGFQLGETVVIARSSGIQRYRAYAKLEGANHTSTTATLLVDVEQNLLNTDDTWLGGHNSYNRKIPFSSGNTFTLWRTNHIFANDTTAWSSPVEPIYSDREDPATAATLNNTFWINTVTGVQSRYDTSRAEGDRWVVTPALYIGVAAIDSDGNAQAYRCTEFYKEITSRNESKFFYNNGRLLPVPGFEDAKVDVFGKLITLGYDYYYDPLVGPQEGPNLGSATASTPGFQFGCYITERREPRRDVPGIYTTGGWKHPTENWRQVAEINNHQTTGSFLVDYNRLPYQKFSSEEEIPTEFSVRYTPPTSGDNATATDLNSYFPWSTSPFFTAATYGTDSGTRGRLTIPFTSEFFVLAGRPQVKSIVNTSSENVYFRVTVNNTNVVVTSVNESATGNARFDTRAEFILTMTWGRVRLSEVLLWNSLKG